MLGKLSPREVAVIQAIKEMEAIRGHAVEVPLAEALCRFQLEQGLPSTHLRRLRQYGFLEMVDGGYKMTRLPKPHETTGGAFVNHCPHADSLRFLSAHYDAGVRTFDEDHWRKPPDEWIDPTNVPKPSDENKAAAQPQEAVPLPRRRGRPPGSKNKGPAKPRRVLPPIPWPPKYLPMLPAPKPVLALPAPKRPTLSLPAPWPRLALPAPARVLSLVPPAPPMRELAPKPLRPRLTAWERRMLQALCDHAFVESVFGGAIPAKVSDRVSLLHYPGNSHPWRIRMRLRIRGLMHGWYFGEPNYALRWSVTDVGCETFESHGLTPSIDLEIAITWIIAAGFKPPATLSLVKP